MTAARASVFGLAQSIDGDIEGIALSLPNAALGAAAAKAHFVRDVRLGKC